MTNAALTSSHPNSSQSHSQSSGPPTPSAPSTPFGERTDGTQSAVKLVEDVVHGVKAAVEGALTWAEKKVDKLSAEEEHESTGPYTSAACMPSDLDVIASGILPTMPAVRQHDGNDEHTEKKEEKAQEEDKKEEDKKEEAKAQEDGKKENKKVGEAEPKF
jgi:hypothetical protein